MTKNKIEEYILKNKAQKNDYEKQIENYKNLQIENNKLKQKINVLENEKKELYKRIKNINLKQKLI